MSTLLHHPDLVPMVEAFPNYEEVYKKLKRIDRYGTGLLDDVVQLQISDVRVAFGAERFPRLMVWPVTVPSGAADGAGSTLTQGVMLTLTDMVTSIHIVLALLPEFAGHVSVSMQCNTMQSIKVGESIYIVSRIDKMGKRMVYTSVNFISAAVEDEVGEGKDIEGVIRCHSEYANGKHVKVILSPNVPTTH